MAFTSIPQPLIKNLMLRHAVNHAIRAFFRSREYIEVETPVMVHCPGIDPHIDAISVEGGMYLTTSPELQMKRLMGMGLKRIFQLTRAFRKGEIGAQHNPEFSLLEWYHAGEDYLYLMDEVEALIRCTMRVAEGNGCNSLSLAPAPFPRHPIDEVFESQAGWIPSRDWDEERFFLDLVEKIEPWIATYPAVILHDFPSPLASLARVKPDAPHLCERFELYLHGLEIANAFSELTDPTEQEIRFKKAQGRRKEMGKDPYPLDIRFLQTLKEGLLPACAGIALGIDRLLMVLSGERDIGQVMAFPHPYL